VRREGRLPGPEAPRVQLGQGRTDVHQSRQLTGLQAAQLGGEPAAVGQKARLAGFVRGQGTVVIQGLGGGKQNQHGNRKGRREVEGARRQRGESRTASAQVWLRKGSHQFSGVLPSSGS